MSLLTTLLTIIITIIVIIINAAIGLVIGVASITSSLIRIILQILGIIQTVLTMAAFFFIFLGYICRIGINIFATMAAPIIAYLASQFTIALGKLLGGLSLAIFSILGILLLLALPIAIIAVVYTLISGEENGDGDEGNEFVLFTNLNLSKYI
jgi:hypothetical protein